MINAIEELSQINAWSPIIKTDLMIQKGSLKTNLIITLKDYKSELG